MTKYENWCDTCEADTEHELVQYEKQDRYGIMAVADLVCIHCDTCNHDDIDPEELRDPDYARDIERDLY